MFQVISILVIAVLTVLDRVSKIAAINYLKSGNEKDILFGLIKLRYVENTGAAFSAFSGNTAALTLFTFLVIVLCLFVLLTKRVSSKFVNVCLVLIIAGGIGNEIDRIAYHYVVDFIDPQFVNFAVFNVADCFITVGAFLLIGYEFYQLILEKKQAAKEKENKQENDDSEDKLN